MKILERTLKILFCLIIQSLIKIKAITPDYLNTIVKKLFVKTLKILGYIFLTFFLCLVIISLSLPYFLKDKIKSTLDQFAEKRLTAELHIDQDKIGLSLLSNFPNVGVSLRDVSIIGRDNFKEDTLLFVTKLTAGLDFWNLVLDAKIQINSIFLQAPNINAHVLPNGQANWDIFKKTPENQKNKRKNPLQIRRWGIKNAQIRYWNQQKKHYMLFKNFFHQGKRSNQASFSNYYTHTTANQYTLLVANKQYFKNQSLDLKINFKHIPSESKFTLSKSNFKINDFTFNTKGYIQQIKDELYVDLSYEVGQNQFKNILSLIPEIYQKDFSKIKTSGLVEAKGWTKGIISQDNLPAFHLDLDIKNGMFQYPGLPQAISNIQLSLEADCKEGVLNDTKLNLENLHLDFGNNYINAKGFIDKIYNGKIYTQASAKINLEDLNKVYPIPNLSLKGNLLVNAKAKGRYNQTQLPVMQAKATLSNGFIQSSTYPQALEEINLSAFLENKTGQYKDMKIAIEKAEMILDNEKLLANAYFENLNDLQYDLAIQGNLNLEKLDQIYPIHQTTLRGNVRGNIQTKGKLSDLNHQRYDLLPTSGQIQIQDFFFQNTVSLPQGIKITQAKGTFTPQKIILEECRGFLGNSDLRLKGNISNYLAYTFQDKKIRGELTLTSNYLNTNDLKRNQNTSRAKSGVIEIPSNIDFNLNTQIAKVILPKVDIHNLKGYVRLSDGKLWLQNTHCQILEGDVKVSGFYDPFDLVNPAYQLTLQVEHLSINETHRSLIDKKHNLGKNIQGDLSSTVDISGHLGQDMKLLYDKSMQGNIQIKIPQIRIKRLNLVRGINKFIKLDNMEEFVIEHILVNATIKEGIVFYQPTNFLVNGIPMKLEGYNSLQGILDFKLNMLIPKKKIGAIAEVAIAALTKQKLFGVKELSLNFTITETYAKPKITPLREDGSTLEIKNTKLKAKIEKKREERKARLKENIAYLNKTPEEVLLEAEQKASKTQLDAQKEAELIRTQADSLEKVEIETAQRKKLIARKTAEKLAKMKHKKAYKKADKIIREANKKAEEIRQNAQAIAKKLKE